MKGRKAFTLAELVVAITLVAVIAIIAIPGFSKTKAKADKNRAIAYLRTIRAAEKMYYGKWRTYRYFTSATDIKSGLDLDVNVSGYVFTVTTGVGASVASTCAMVATDSNGKTLTLTESGTWGGTNTPLPGISD